VTGSPVIRESRSEKRAGSASRRFIPPSSHWQDGTPNQRLGQQGCRSQAFRSTSYRAHYSRYGIDRQPEISEMKGAGSTTCTTPRPASSRQAHTGSPCERLTNRVAGIPVALASSHHSQDTLRCQRKSEIGNTARRYFPESGHVGSGGDFRSKTHPRREAIFMKRQRNFLGAGGAPVTFWVRHLWRTNHAPRTQEKQAATTAYLASYATHRRQV